MSNFKMTGKYRNFDAHFCLVALRETVSWTSNFLCMYWEHFLDNIIKGITLLND